MTEPTTDHALLEEFHALLHEGEEEALKIFLRLVRPEDIAEWLDLLSADDRQRIVSVLDIESAGTVLTDTSASIRAELVEEIEPERLARIAEALPADEAADLIGELEVAETEKVLHHISTEDEKVLRHLLTYPEDTAGGLMNPEVVALQPAETVDDAIRYLRSAAENNAEVYEEATTVKNYGKFAVIGDSEKAPVMFIQSGKTPIGGTTGPGSWVWAELWTDDIDKATTFYADVVGVGHDTTDRGGQAYHLFTSQGKPRAGIVKIPDELEDVEPGWAPYVDVTDLAKTKDRVRELGGRVIFATDDNPARGAIALILDPTGAALFIHQIGSEKEVTE